MDLEKAFEEAKDKLTPDNQHYCYFDDKRISIKKIFSSNIGFWSKLLTEEVLDQGAETLDSQLYTLTKFYFEDLKREKAKNTDIDYEIYIDVECPRGSEIVYNKKTNIIAPVTGAAFRKIIGSEHRKFINEIGVPPARKKYYPYREEPIYTEIMEDDNEITVINTHVKPEWTKVKRSKAKKGGKASVPRIIAKFMTHLFPIKEQRLRVYDWVYCAYSDKNEVVLVLNGVKGIGKNLFADLLSAYVGRKNFAVTQDSFGDSQFNSIMANKRVLFIDEIRGNVKMHNRLKKYANRYQSIERKGVDVKDSEEIFCSILAANNNIDHFYLEWDDRRFSVPDITNTRLRDVWTEKDIKEFNATIEDPESMAQFALALEERAKDRKPDPFYTVKEDRYWSLVYASLSGANEALVDFLLNYKGHYIAYSDLEAEVSKQLRKNEQPLANGRKVGEFLKNYLHRGEKKLARVEKIDGEYMFILDHNWDGESKIIGDYKLDEGPENTDSNVL